MFIRAGSAVQFEAPKSDLRVRYFHEDHLGSSSVIADSNGSLVEESTFFPFGAPRNQFRAQQTLEPYQFTQKERDAESSLHYFEARYLKAGLARFVSADHLFLNPDNLSSDAFLGLVNEPQKLNLYSYVLNNPVKVIDPTGFDPRPPTISTPLEGEGRTFTQRRDKSVEVTLKNNVKVIILPDKYDLPRDQDPQTEPLIVPSQGAIGPNTREITYKITIQTRYPRGYDPSGKSDYGRGTTDQDIKDKNTSVRFHEGQHGARALDYLESHPLPQLNPDNKPYSQDYTWRDAANEWKGAMENYNDAIGEYHKQNTDCVGHVPWFCK
jgi:RHS repeat-associated protein